MKNIIRCRSFIILFLLIFLFIGCKKKEKCLPPEFTIKPGIYSEYSEIGITCKTPKARIFYTTDGSKPSHMDKEYKGELFKIDIGDKLDLKVIAISKGFKDSDIVEGKYKGMRRISKPEFNISPGNYNKSITLLISYNKGEVHYTLNGKTPNKSSTIYKEGIVLNSGKTIVQMIAISSDKNEIDSEIVSGEYNIELPKLEFLTKPGNFEGEQAEIILSDDNNIYYTTDGSEPKITSNKYNGNILIFSGKTVIRAKRIIGNKSEGEISGEFNVRQINNNRSYINSDYKKDYINSEQKEKENNIYRSYGGEGNDRGKKIKKTNDGGYIMIGGSESRRFQSMYNHGGEDILVVKTNKKGDIVWQKMYGGNGDDIGYSIVSANDGGYVIVGESNSRDIPRTKYNNNKDIYIIKLNESGDMVWQKMYGGNGDDTGYSVVSANDGGYVIAGIYENKNNDMYILKISEDGQKQWEKTYGGNSNDNLYCISKSSKGGYILAGSSDSEDFGAIKGFKDAAILKVSNNGHIEWKNFYGGNKNDSASQIKEDSQGYIFVGDSQGDMSINSCGKSDIYIAKISDTGKLLWNKLFGTSNNEYGYDFTIDTDGYTIAGYSEGKSDVFYMVKMNKQAVPIWVKQFEGMGNSYCYSIEKLNSGYILLGDSNGRTVSDLANKGNSDFLVIKVNERGESYN